jgi:arylmalonate decarboxylase
VPPTNTANEPEFYRMAPPGVSIHSARMKIHRDPTAAGFYALLADHAPAVADLAQARVNVIAYACTMSSIAYPIDRLIAAIRERARVPGISAASARREPAPTSSAWL